MALRGTEPTHTDKRLKLMLYGPPGVGKTTAALQFPKPYFIDTERGAEHDEYVDKLKAAGGVRWFCNDAEEVIREVQALTSTQHDYQTLVIDPITTLWDNLLDEFAQTVGEDFGKNKAPAKRLTKRLYSHLLRLDMNVVLVSHVKDKWETRTNAKGKEERVQTGVTFDAYDGSDRLFDLVLRLERQGKDRVAHVMKTRLASFGDGEMFAFSYDEIHERLGDAMLERQSQPVELVSAEDAERLEQLLSERKDGETVKAKWLKKANASEISDMEADVVRKCIEHLTSKGAA